MSVKKECACSPNFRDVAALVPSIKPGVLFRSDFIDDPDEADADLITACGIRLVFDLRGEHERARHPNSWLQASGAQILTFDVASSGDPRRMMEALGSGNASHGAHGLMREAYRSFPAGAVPVLRALGERIAAGDVPVLIHCTAGKDRTGWTVAALLLALGVDEGTVERDFLASQGRVHARTHETTRLIMNSQLGVTIDEDALATLGGVHADYLHSAIAAVKESYGSLAAYVREAGLEGDRLARLREVLLR